jgi:hypothetical protein
MGLNVHYVVIVLLLALNVWQVATGKILGMKGSIKTTRAEDPRRFWESIARQIIVLVIFVIYTIYYARMLQL